MTFKTAYHESEWAVRRWDWFNGGRIVRPLSFCQFWRTALVWATIKWLLFPVQWFEGVMPRVPMPGFLRHLILLPLKGCWLALRLSIRTLWLLIYPLRQGAKPVGHAALAGGVSAGKRIQAFGQRHKTGLQRLGLGFLIVFYGSLLTFWAVLAFLASWFWTLVIGGGAIGGVMVGSFALYGFFKSGALGLLWGATVVTHDAICPPATIFREG